MKKYYFMAVRDGKPNHLINSNGLVAEEARKFVTLLEPQIPSGTKVVTLTFIPKGEDEPEPSTIPEQES